MPSDAASNRVEELDRRDHLLLDAAQGGDAVAVSALLERHQTAVYGYLRPRVLDAPTADELLRTVFSQFLTDKLALLDDTPVLRRLQQLARAALSEHAHKRRRHAAGAWTELCLKCDESSLPEHEPRSVREHSAVLDALDESARNALLMHYRDRLTLSEIALKLKRSESAVRGLLDRARAALRAEAPLSQRDHHAE